MKDLEDSSLRELLSIPGLDIVLKSLQVSTFSVS